MFCFFQFSQLRAQNQVLKKAVVDEQANSVSLKVECYSQKSTRKVELHHFIFWIRIESTQGLILQGLDIRIVFDSIINLHSWMTF